MSADTKKCFLCDGGLKNPRLLPCTDSFCLACLEVRYKGELSGASVKCPECGIMFMIPEKGIAALNMASFGPPTTSEVCSTNQPITPIRL